MPLAKLRKMETMYKKEYINAVMDEHDEVGKLLVAKQENSTKVYQKLEDMIMDLEDQKGVWNA